MHNFPGMNMITCVLKQTQADIEIVGGCLSITKEELVHLKHKLVNVYMAGYLLQNDDIYCECS